jgi:hypothetical protein
MREDGSVNKVNLVTGVMGELNKVVRVCVVQEAVQ